MQNKITSIVAILLLSIATVALMLACSNRSEEPESRENVEKAVDTQATNGEIDEPDGFEVNILAAHAPFTDELAAHFRLKFAEGGGEAIVNDFEDASTMIFAEVDWDETGSSSGWHLHPGIVLVSMVEGEIEVTWDRDCVPRTYAAGDGWLDPGDIHNALSVSDGAKAYAVFLGIPDGEPATQWVEPVQC